MQAVESLRTMFPPAPACPRVQPHLDGWLKGSNVHMLEPFVQKAKVGVEIGTWLGQSAMWQLKTNPELKLICIDTWLAAYTYHIAPFLPFAISDLYDKFLANTWEYRDRLTAIRQDSFNGLRLLRAVGLKPDYIYIDGGHDYETVIHDIRFCLRNFPEAALIGDDYDYNEVAAAVGEARKFASPGKRLRVQKETWSISYD